MDIVVANGVKMYSLVLSPIKHSDYVLRELKKKNTSSTIW